MTIGSVEECVLFVKCIQLQLTEEIVAYKMNCEIF